MTSGFTFPISPLSPSITYHLFYSNDCSQKRSQKNFISHFTLVNLKEISLPSYKSDNMKVSEMNKLKLPYFQLFLNIRNVIYSYIY